MAENQMDQAVVVADAPAEHAVALTQPRVEHADVGSMVCPVPICTMPVDGTYLHTENAMEPVGELLMSLPYVVSVLDGCGVTFGLRTTSGLFNKKMRDALAVEPAFWTNLRHDCVLIARRRGIAFHDLVHRIPMQKLMGRFNVFFGAYFALWDVAPMMACVSVLDGMPPSLAIVTVPELGYAAMVGIVQHRQRAPRVECRQPATRMVTEKRARGPSTKESLKRRILVAQMPVEERIAREERHLRENTERFRRSRTPMLNSPSAYMESEDEYTDDDDVTESDEEDYY